MTGFNTSANRIYLNTGDKSGLAVDAPEFLRTWNWAGRWAMVVLSPGHMPAQASLSRYTEAVLAFEKVAGADSTAPAWQAALERWPQAPGPYLALGNRAYTGGNLALAVDYYGRGLRRTGSDTALANNLASVLGELGCAGAGIALLEPIHAGLPEASDWRPVTAATLAELAAIEPGDEDCLPFPLPDLSRWSIVLVLRSRSGRSAVFLLPTTAALGAQG